MVSHKPTGRSGERRGDDRSSGRWTVVVLKIARQEGHALLTDLQYAHMVGVLKRLVDFGNQRELADLRIAPIGSFWELKDKGGPLGRKNIRVYFAAVNATREVVTLKVYKKEQEAQVGRHVVINVEDRLEDFLAGKNRAGSVVYRAQERS